MAMFTGRHFGVWKGQFALLVGSGCHVVPLNWMDLLLLFCAAAREL